MIIEPQIEPVANAYGVSGRAGARQNPSVEVQSRAEQLSTPFHALVATAQRNARGGIAVRDSEALSSQMFEPAVSDSHARRKQALRDDDSGDVAAAGANRMDTTSVQARGAAGQSRTGSANTPQADDRSGLALNDYGGDRAAIRTQADASGVTDGRHRADGKALDFSQSLIHQDGAAARLKSESEFAPAGSQAYAESNDGGLQAARLAESATAVVGSSQIRAGGPQSNALAQQIAQSITSRVGQVELIRAVSSSSSAQNAGPHTGQQKTSEGASSSRAGRHESSPSSMAEADKAGRSEFDQLVRSIRFKTGERHSSARLHLDPPELGRIQVDVRMEGDQLQISVRAETSEARELLSRRAAQLRTALQHHGIHVDRFDVTLDFLIQQGAEDGKQSGTGLAASPERDGNGREMDTAEDSVSLDDTNELAEEAGEPAIAAAGNTRLDIRI